jgi:hypothetical protein
LSEVRNLDAGAYGLPTLQGREPALHRLDHGAVPGSVERHQMRDVVNDTRSRSFCGPTAVAAISWQPISVVRDAFRFVRHGSGWPMQFRAPAIMGTTHREVEAALQVFGFYGRWQAVRGNPTLAAFLDQREGVLRTHPCIVHVTGHWVAVSGWTFCDTLSDGRVVDAEEAPGRRKRVKNVFLITGTGHPASEIPRKHYPAARAGSGHDCNGRGARGAADA